MGDVTAVGDEGGFAPNSLKSDEEAIEKILEAIKAAGYEPGKDFMIAMDAASSEWKSEKGKGFYKQPKSGKEFTSDELIAHWESLVDKYPIISIEDGLDEEDWEGWQKMTAKIGNKVQLVGDDLFVTNTERLSKGIKLGAGNSILIKLNQIGSVSRFLKLSRWLTPQATQQFLLTVQARLLIQLSLILLLLLTHVRSRQVLLQEVSVLPNTTSFSGSKSSSELLQFIRRWKHSTLKSNFLYLTS